jgi:hypothetical protein
MQHNFVLRIEANDRCTLSGGSLEKQSWPKVAASRCGGKEGRPWLCRRSTCGSCHSLPPQLARPTVQNHSLRLDTRAPAGVWRTKILACPTQKKKPLSEKAWGGGKQECFFVPPRGAPSVPPLHRHGSGCRGRQYGTSEAADSDALTEQKNVFFDFVTS